jgi:tetratricopeptide (TPR) repeat protein
MSKNRKHTDEEAKGVQEKWSALWKDPEPDAFSLHARQGYRQLRDPNRARQLLSGLNKRMDEKLARRRPARRISLLLPLGIAASLALLVLFTWLREPRADQLAYRAFDPLPVAGAGVGVRGASEGSVSGDLRERAFALYEAGAYEQALEAFSSIDTADPVTTLYQGISHLGAKQARKAAHHLQRTAEQLEPDSPIARAATWYLALSYLADEQIDLAKQKLEELARSPGDYQREAAALRSEMD